LVNDGAALVQELSTEVRTISHLLHPPLLDEAELASALRWYVEGFAQRSKIKVDLEFPADFGRATTQCPAANCCPEVKSTKITSRAKEHACCFKALAEPMRIRILNLLANNDDPVCVGEIVKHFSIQQSSISHHLKILRDCRFVLAERRGTLTTG